MRITIKDIASKVGVSANTVTKALSGRPGVSDSVRERIKHTANELGYTPNHVAKALRREELRIGLLYPEEPHEYYENIKKGLREAIDELRDYRVTGVFMPIPDIKSRKEAVKALAKLRSSRIDGLILSPGVNFSDYSETIHEIARTGIPIVSLTVDIDKADRIGSVGLNGILAGRMAAEFLDHCVKSERSFAVIACSTKIFSQQDCIKGFMEEAENRGRTVCGIYESQDDKSLAAKSVNKLIKKSPDVGGIYVCSYNSVSVCEKIDSLGRKDDISVIGQDIYPELSSQIRNGGLIATLFQDPVAQSRTAVRMLYEYLSEKKNPSSDVLFTPTLVLRTNLDFYESVK